MRWGCGGPFSQIPVQEQDQHMDTNMEYCALVLWKSIL